MIKVRVSANDAGLLAMRSYAEIQCEREYIPTTDVSEIPTSRKPNMEEQDNRRNRFTSRSIQKLKAQMMRSSY